MTDTPGGGLRVLLVEDDPDVLRFLEVALTRAGFQVHGVEDGRSAVRKLHRQDFDVVVSDLRIPGIGGDELLGYVRLHRPDLPFVMLTGLNDVQTAVDVLHQGADEYLLKPIPPATLVGRVLRAVERRALEMERGRRARVADQAGLIGFLRAARALVNGIEAKDRYTRDHSRKVAHVAVAMARRLPGLTRRQVREIRTGALLHDVGKIGVPLPILHKQGPLTPEEWAEVRQHPLHGDRILQPLAQALPEVRRIVRCEHERWDGHGYPDGLAGEQIPLGSRLIMIADTYDAICSSRPYRPALTKEDALEVIRAGSGSQFDPKLVPVFESVLPELPDPRP